MSDERYVLVTTEWHGVFVGRLVEEHDNGLPTWRVVLADSRMVTRWNTDTRGVFGLAARGPQGAGNRIGPAVIRQDLRGVTSVTSVSPDARKLLEAEPWS